MQHIGRRLRWSHPQFIIRTRATIETSILDEGVPDGILFVGMEEDQLEAGIWEAMDRSRPRLILTFESKSERLQSETTVDGQRLYPPSPFASLGRWYPWSKSRTARNRIRLLNDLWHRHTSDDILYAIQSAIHYFLTPLPEMTQSSTGLDVGRCIARNCRQPFLDCLLDPECRKALDCLASCGANDQVCSYRCIASHESKNLEQFSLCILQKHNCLNNFASIPRLPHVDPMATFRGQPLTHEAAEEVFIGHLGEHPWSWKIAYGKNPAYDYFPCQFQLFYRGRGRGMVWYDPVFQVITLDGRRVWRRRHYRVRRATVPGAFHFSVLDNGVTSQEFWRIVDVEENLRWALFYYAGAASVAGIHYTGAVLGTIDGKPPEDEARVKAALRRCGIEAWELSTVDYSCCTDPPLEIPSMYVSSNPVQGKQSLLMDSVVDD